jgi:hypothetical protein
MKMKKTIKTIFALAIGCALFFSCEDPYAGQEVAAPGAFEQPALQDASFTAAVTSAANPLTITAAKLTASVDFINVSSKPTLKDTAAHIEYKVILSNLENFTVYKTINTVLTGSNLSATYKQLNDTLKGLNPVAGEHNAYARLLAYIVKGGTMALYTTANLPFKVTTYNYPPVAVKDLTTLPMNSSITIDVLSNDTDPENNTLTIASVGTPGHGTAVISSGKILYTPTVGYFGPDSFSYTISDGFGNTSTINVDATILEIVPYTAIKPRPYYIIGMANGAWNNSVSGLGVSIYPMSVIPGDKYNSAGDGQFTYTGYFWSSRGFKLIRDLGNWDEQWGGQSNDITKPLHNNGGSGDFKVPADGFYTITLNSITNTFSMVAASVTPKSFTSMGMIGEFNGWGGDVAMAPAETSNNHIWYTTYTFTTDFTPPVGNGGCKFRANGGWNDNWGGGSFPVGIGTNGGTNIPFKAGTYTVIFNDISGCFYFIK